MLKTEQFKTDRKGNIHSSDTAYQYRLLGLMNDKTQVNALTCTREIIDIELFQPTVRLQLNRPTILLVHVGAHLRFVASPGKWYLQF